MLVTPSRPHGITTQKTTSSIFTATRTSNQSSILYQFFRQICGTLKMVTAYSSETMAFNQQTIQHNSPEYY
jgi:hypothetical protein